MRSLMSRPVQTPITSSNSQRSLDVNTADTRVRMNTAHKRSMKHVGKTNITDVDAASGEKATGLVRLNTAADERS